MSKWIVIDHMGESEYVIVEADTALEAAKQSPWPGDGADEGEDYYVSVQPAGDPEIIVLRIATLDEEANDGEY